MDERHNTDVSTAAEELMNCIVGEYVVHNYPNTLEVNAPYIYVKFSCLVVIIPII